MSAPDTGESTASINARADDRMWPAILAALKTGATIVRPSRLRTFYVDRGQGPTSGGLSATRVRRLEREGVLVHVGVDRYGLNRERVS